MTDDVHNLLNQLGQPTFDYREFGGTEGPAGYWPIFRTVIGHPNLAHLPGSRHSPFNEHGRAAPPEDTNRPDLSPEEQPAFVERRLGGPGAIFRRYRSDAPAAADASENDVRGLLRRLSEGHG